MRTEKLEQEIRGDRLQIYNDILQPFIMLFTKEEAAAGSRAQKGKSKEQRALEKMMSPEYREVAFKLTLFANDGVVRAYNKLMQFAYKRDRSSELSDGHDPNVANFEILEIFATLLLEIRRSVGNEATSLSKFEMLEWLIKDIDTLKVQIQEVKRR